MKRLFCVSYIFVVQQAMADCSSPPNRIQEFQISACRNISPSDDSALINLAKKFSDSESVLAQYQGLEIEAEDLLLFIPVTLKPDCSKIARFGPIKAEVSHACCDGDPNPPCLLGYSEYVVSFR